MNATTSTTSRDSHVNGLDVTAIRAAINGVAQDRSLGGTSWKVSSRWQGGAVAEHQVDGYEIGGTSVARSFAWKTDEPLELGGTNLHANPQELLLSGLNACMLVGYAMTAALMGIRIDSLEIETSGEIDLRGMFELADKVSNGYDSLRQTVRISADATPEQLAELHAAVLRTSPNFFNITHAIAVQSELVVE
ncbi:OsmC family protein [Blastopirellula sp. JC732]|uniref:OsmC family protein n=1 Tax=Blastopirellula sediminis TaxID=2894196 RepID=A0A9X1MPK0_9BACT|nr:OsmC family protein [Blastopirellula sediminis]MCC9606687.1 OsmC family protein [Blastopirellula sediminis]MCC9630015.1 OsmC family protein [Blastopirellula sediminis]